MKLYSGLNLSELPTETLITWIALALILILVIVIIVQVRKVMITLLNRSIFIKDEIYIEHDTQLRLEFSNKSYVNTALLEIGFYYKKEYFAVVEDELIVQARSFEKLDYSLEQLREKLLKDSRKVKPIFIYTKNSVGEVVSHKAKRITRHLKKVIKLENKALKAERKQERFETGNYNFLERVGLVLKWIFSPLVKLNRFIKRKINQGLKKRELRLKDRKQSLEQLESVEEVISEIEDATIQTLEETNPLEEINLQEASEDQASNDYLEEDLEKETENEDQEEIL